MIELNGRGVLGGLSNSHNIFLSSSSAVVKRRTGMLWCSKQVLHHPVAGVDLFRRNIIYSLPIDIAESGMLEDSQDL
jgi:hypothetical protein